MSDDFYDMLGVSKDATEEEIQQAFRTKAAEYHPDVSDDPDAEEKFKKIKKAKEVLTDEEKRQAYDQMGQALWRRWRRCRWTVRRCGRWRLRGHLQSVLRGRWRQF